jgi:exodeoxyribonuclease VII small subunit
VSGSGPAGAETGDATFEELMAALEDVTAKLAAGEIGIEAAADLYERAERLHALASERLRQVRARVGRLTGGVEGAAGEAGVPGSTAAEGGAAEAD